MLNNPIVFLDIDGVLNCAEDYEQQHLNSLIFYNCNNFVNKAKLKNLYEFLDEIDAKIIFVSSWFWSNPDTEERIHENTEIIIFLGLQSRTLDILKYTGGGLSRGREVLRIVEELDLISWIVLDDAGSNMYDFDTHQICSKVGLLDSDIEIFKERLKNGKH